MSYDDPIVNEVRTSRELIWQRFKGDMNGYFKFIREEENKNPEKIARAKTVQLVLDQQSHKSSEE